MIALVLGGSVLLVVLAALGLSRMGGAEAPKASVEELVTGARWVRENGETRVTVVEFSDVQCPACKAAQPVAHEVAKMSGVKFVYRHFPLIQIHQNAWMGARAAEAAFLMGKGYEYKDLLFERQGEWEFDDKAEEKFVAYAKQLGLDEKEFETKMRSEQTDKAVGEDSSLGNRLRLQGTPTFFVNGELVATNFLKQKVEELLK